MRTEDTKTPIAKDVMTRCHDVGAVLEFCGRDHIRYRHIIENLTEPAPEWTKAFHTYYGYLPDMEADCFVDAPQEISLLGYYRNRRLRLDGASDRVPLDGLREWCSRLNPYGVATTFESLMYLLREVVGSDGWSRDCHYTVTAETFCEHASHEVVRLTPADLNAYEAFLERPADVPFLNVRRADGKLARDFQFLCEGVPMDCYGVRMDGDIVGALTVQPMTNLSDELSRVYVAREYRGQGIAQSLISHATRDILDRGRQPACAGGGALGISVHVLKKLGYNVVCRFWHRRFWSDVPPGAVASDSKTE